jgi:hypothetical protein
MMPRAESESNMDDEEIHRLADAIEATADLSGAKSKLHQGKSPPLRITANRAGFLRLAGMFLRAATLTIPDDDCRSKSLALDERLEQVGGTQEADRFIGLLQRMETWPEPEAMIEQRKRRARANNPLPLMACALVAFVFLLFFIIGVGVVGYAVVVWLRG